MLRLALLGLLISAPLIGCGGKDTEDDDDTIDTSDTLLGGGGSGGGNPDANCSDDGVSPCIEDIDAWCYENTVGNSAFFWQVVIEADDPQGDDTIEDGTVTVTKDGETVHEAWIVCDDSDCFGTWNANATNPSMGCSESSAPNYTFKAIIVDENGNVSEAGTTVGYLGYQ